MSYFKQYFLAIIGCFLLASCTTNFKKFYKPIVDAKSLSNVQLLVKMETPIILYSKNIDLDVNITLSKNYILIGSSNFIGELESERSLISQARAVNAGFVIVYSEFLNSITTTESLLLPNSQTSYSNGTVYGSYGHVNYSESTTSNNTMVVPYTSTQHQYLQKAFFFVKNKTKQRVGVNVVDLSSELRTKLERNTGVLVDVVYEESPAFIANILVSDVIIEVNGINIINSKQASDLLQQLPQGKLVLKIIRNGIKKSIVIEIGDS